MPGEIVILVVCDVDPDRPDYGGVRFDRLGPLTWRGVSEGIPRLLAAAAGLRDSLGRGFKATWCVRADEQIERCHGSADWVRKEFAALWDRTSADGHELAWHAHHWRWSGAARCWLQETEDEAWQQRNLALGAAAWPQRPRVSRLGWYAMNDATMDALRVAGVELDLTGMPGMKRRGAPDARGALFVGHYDWSRCRRRPYRPHASDYQLHDPRGDGLIELPLTTIDSRLLGWLTDLRYRLRGSGRGAAGARFSVNLTAHPWLFAPMIRHALREAQAGRVYFGAYFHPDELLGVGPRLLGQPLYSAEHAAGNLARLTAQAQRQGVVVRFVAATELLPELRRQLAPPAESELRPRLLGLAELPEVIELSRRVFAAAAATPDYDLWLRHKHTHTTERATEILVLEDQGRLAAQDPLLDVRVWWFGRELTTTLSCDTAVLPEHQGKGCFGLMAREQLARLRARGVAFNWGFPNERIYPLRTDGLGWGLISPTPFLLRPLDAGAVTAAAVGRAPGIGLASPLARGLWRLLQPLPRARGRARLEEVGAFGDEIDRLWSTVRQRLGISVARDRARLARRYHDAPGAGYAKYHIVKGNELVGAAVARLLSKRGLLVWAICEFLVADPDDDAPADALGALLRRGREAGAQAAGACCFRHQPEYAAFRRNGFLPTPTWLQPERARLAAYPLSLGRETDLLFDPRQWSLSWGDTDNV